MRYVSKPATKAEWLWSERHLPSLNHPSVYEKEPVKTGITDADGNDIYRLPDPIGFLGNLKTGKR